MDAASAPVAPAEDGALASSSSGSMVQAGLAHLRLGEADAAQRQFVAALSIEADCLLEMLAESGNKESASEEDTKLLAAENAYSSVIELQASNALHWANRSAVRYELKRVEDALVDAKQAVVLNQSLVKVLRPLGIDGTRSSH
jgi:hypothetical protein